jgi:hypothetical protein
MRKYVKKEVKKGKCIICNENFTSVGDKLKKFCSAYCKLKNYRNNLRKKQVNIMKIKYLKNENNG